MAQKRMFDKAIIDTDKFCEMPSTSKALYFLLGMEADDLGFVSPRRVLRLHNLSDDDLKILITKGYLIYFQSGVVVITDWNKNNWLDSRRKKQTEFKDELETLELFENKYFTKANNEVAKPLLSECLASIEESSIEENRIEENNIKTELDNSVNLLKETYSRYFKTISKKFTTKKVKVKVEKILKENKVDFNCVVKGLDNYLKSCVDEKDRLTNDITYIRNCERFLNEELWNDFLEDIDYSKQTKSGVKTIGSTESWNKVEERELTEEERQNMEDIIKKMKGNS